MKHPLHAPKAFFGILMMIIASSLFGLMSAAVYAASQLKIPVAPEISSFVRVSINLAILLIPGILKGEGKDLFGDFRPSLWLRGLFGGLSLILSFVAIQRIGPGESSFLTACSGIFVAALSPRILGQRNGLLEWTAILGAISGLFLLAQPEKNSYDFEGRLMGLGSGVLAALAYLMIARAGRTNSPGTIVFYFCLVAFWLHVFGFSLTGFNLPHGTQAWLLVSSAGLLGTIAQFCLTRAYQSAPATLISAVGFLSPVISLILGASLFQKQPSPRALLGCGLILGFGLLLPCLQLIRRKDVS